MENIGLEPGRELRPGVVILEGGWWVVEIMGSDEMTQEEHVE